MVCLDMPTTYYFICNFSTLDAAAGGFCRLTCMWGVVLARHLYLVSGLRPSAGGGTPHIVPSQLFAAVGLAQIARHVAAALALADVRMLGFYGRTLGTALLELAVRSVLLLRGLPTPPLPLMLPRASASIGLDAESTRAVLVGVPPRWALRRAVFVLALRAVSLPQLAQCSAHPARPYLAASAPHLLL